MNNIRLGLFQESSDRFAFALHVDAERDGLYRQFSAHDLSAAIVLKDSAPVCHVALAFSFYPLLVTLAEGTLVRRAVRPVVHCSQSGVS